MWESSIPRTSVSWPVTAAAAAITGEQRWVRPPAPWRPSKLRFDVDAQRSLSPSLSGFIARHIEQPGWRHSKPASARMRSSPSSSACHHQRSAFEGARRREGRQGAGGGERRGGGWREGPAAPAPWLGWGFVGQGWGEGRPGSAWGWVVGWGPVHLLLDEARAGHHEGLLDVGRHLTPLGDRRDGADVFDPAVGARADEDLVHWNRVDRRLDVLLQPHVPLLATAATHGSTGAMAAAATGRRRRRGEERGRGGRWWEVLGGG